MKHDVEYIGTGSTFNSFSVTFTKNLMLINVNQVTKGLMALLNHGKRF